MNTFTLVLRNISQRALSVVLTGISVALGVALISATVEIRRQVEENFNQTSVGYEMIVGAKGSALQLVLNTVYQLGDPVGNIPYATYLRYRNHPMVSYAIPYGLGDNYKGFRIIGRRFSRSLTTSRIRPLSWRKEGRSKMASSMPPC